MSSYSILCVFTEDLLVKIYEKLTCDSDRSTWRLVCTDFQRIDLLYRRTLRVLRVEFLFTLLHKFTCVDNLDLSLCPRIDDVIVSLLVGRESQGCLWKLKTLNLSRAAGLRWPGMEILMRECPALECVDVSFSCGFGDREAAALSFAGGLKELRMDKCLGVTDVGLAKIAVGCGRLERLSLKWCMEISDLGIDLLCKKCLNLSYLDMSYLKVTNQSLRSIATLSKLEVLAMVGCPLVDNLGLQFLENGIPLLQEIDLSRCDRVSSPGLISVIRGHRGLVRINAGYILSELSPTLVQCMKELVNLKTIIIDGALVSEIGFCTMSSYCKSLIEIGLTKCMGVTNVGIVQLLSGCVNLRILNLTCCRSTTDAAISAVAYSCRNLVCLKLESCNMITEKSLEQLGKSCSLLEELDLTDCCGVSDRGLEYVSKCSRLLCLKLGLCTNVSNKGLLHMSTNCSMLLELDLYRCKGIADDGLAALASGCKKLKKLNLSYCDKVTDIGMVYISHMGVLSDLEMRGLTEISSAGLTELAARCKSLTTLDLKHCKKINDLGFLALAYYLQNLRQVNLSYCTVSDMALCMVMGSLRSLQDAKLVHLCNVSVEGFELALRACCGRIKKVKLVAALRFIFSSEIIELLHASGCRIRWD
ncbi:hypothetical protein K2173_027196 [Erythroxylum novogranatense]|uniref:F-box/LRR-repeat protein 15-like leucin rich repeat domain-containing protein n=1 Tax=Erythroxylum novogranatense TaxID=1862640 RepID=A0AAV8U1M6_9ROSI|nr:hypothetical protein K2173_027196 [Erythroxylum novogranatense]